MEDALQEDDPWQWLGSSSQEYLPAAMKPLRVAFAGAFLQRFSVQALATFVAIDPCRSLLPNHEIKSEEQKHAAMGKMGWRSKGALKKGTNCKASRTANSQASGSTSVAWTPIFARGKVKIYMCGVDDSGVEKLTDSASIAKFVREALAAQGLPGSS